METTSLWPSFEEIPEIITPRNILVEQAAFLEKASHGLLKCEITSAAKSTDRTRLIHSFKVIAPFLSNYRFNLLKLDHNAVFIYPAEVINVATSETFNVISDKELIEVLKTIFNHPKTIEILQNVMAQSKALSKETSEY